MNSSKITRRLFIMIVLVVGLLNIIQGLNSYVSISEYVSNTEQGRAYIGDIKKIGETSNSSVLKVLVSYNYNGKRYEEYLDKVYKTSFENYEIPSSTPDEL